MSTNNNQTNIKGQVVSGMFWKFGERIIAQGVSFIVSVILARILLPEDYGAVAVVNIFIALANVFLSSGLNVSLIQKKDADEKDCSTIFWCNLALSIFLYFVLFAFAPLIAKIYKIEILTPVIRVFALSLPVSALQSIETALLSKKMQFKKFFFATIIGTLISAVVGIVMAYKGFGVWALVAQSMTNTFIDTFVLFITVGWRPKWVFSKSSAVPMIKFGYKVTLTDLIGTIFNNLVSFLMGAKYTSADLAFYGNGIKIPRLFRDNIFSTVISVLFPAMSNVSEEQENVKKLTRRAVSLLTYIIFPIMFGIFAVNNTLIDVLYTNKWMGMSPYIAIACIEAAMSISPTIGFQAIKSLGRSDALLKNEFLTKPVFLICLIVGLFISPLAMAIGMLVASVYCTVLACFLMRKIVLYSFHEQLKDILKPLLMSTAMCGIVYLIGIIDFNRIVKLIMQIIAGISIYWGLSVMTKDESYHMLIGMIKKKLGRA